MQITQLLMNFLNMNIVILAAGQGKRMHSNLPKVLHPIAGKPLAQHVIDTARLLSPEKLIVVFGHGGDVVRSTLAADDILWAEQAQQLGTGHAVAQAVWAVRHHATFHDAVVAAIDLGDDTDTVACVAGALAGALGWV